MSSLADIALEAGKQDQDKRRVADIIEFVESSWGLDTPLYPIQRVILKAHYGIPLDDNPYGLDLSQPIPLDHPAYDEITVLPPSSKQDDEVDVASPLDEDLEGTGIRVGYYKLRVKVTDWRRQNPQYISEAEYLRMLYREGRSNIKEVLPGQERRELVLSIGRRSGKCVLGDTLVPTDKGILRIECMGNPNGPEVQPLEVGVAQEGSKRSKSAYFYNGGVKPTRTLTTRYGYRLGGTDNHRIKVLTEQGKIEWKYLGDLVVGDVVCIHRNTDLWAADYVDAPDGSLKEDRGEAWGRAAIDGAGIPGAILRSPRSVVQAFLRGLFDSSALVQDGNVVLPTPNWRFAHEVQVVLLNLGIVGQIRSRSNGQWELRVNQQRDLTVFTERVGFASVEKTDALRNARLEASSDAELIPHQRIWGRRLFEFVSEEHGDYEPALCHEMAYGRVRHLISVAPDAYPEVLNHFNHLLSTDYFFDPVESIEEGSHSVYDLNVPDGESFVANGMTNHNTFMCAAVVAYEVYKLILKGNPQAYYGIPKTNVIQLISVATDKDQAGLLYNEASGHFSNCGFFRPYTANNTQSYAKFQSPEDISRFGRYSDDAGAKATIKVSFKSCIAKGLRGAGNIVIILDELAHFNDVGQSDALRIYRAVKPSLAAFSPKDPTNRRRVIGKVEGRILSISSPLGRQGFFYRKFRQGFAGGLESQNMLCIQAPTWEVNPTVEATFLAEEYATDPDSFFTEYGADFTDRTKGWLTPETLFKCVDYSLRPAHKGVPRAPHFMGVDISAGLVDGDYCAVAIGHLDDQSKIVLDYIERIRSGEGDYKDQERISFDEITDWLYELSRRFYIEKGLFDQWAGIPFETALHNRGLVQCSSVFFTKHLTSQVFANFKTLLHENKLVLFTEPGANDRPDTHAEYIQELLELQAETLSKYVVLVSAPKAPGKHDDFSDALVRMVWEATQHMGKKKYVAGSAAKPGTGASASDMVRVHRKALVQSRLGGSSPDRQQSGIRGVAIGRRVR